MTAANTKTAALTKRGRGECDALIATNPPRLVRPEYLEQ